MRALALLSALAGVFLAQPAYASYIDFKLSGGPDGASSYSTTVDGTTIVVTPGPTGSALYWDSTDGFGVRSPAGNDDEIGASESLIVTFSQPVKITGLDITDLFYETAGIEAGAYAVEGGPSSEFTASDTPAAAINGERTVSTNATGMVLTFTAPNLDSDFSVSGISFHPVPELGAGAAGSALTLVLGGFLVLSFRRRARRT